MLYQYYDCIMTVNAYYLINPDGRVAIIYSLHYFFILYYDMMFYCRKRTHFLPLSLTILHWGELDILGVQDSLYEFGFESSLLGLRIGTTTDSFHLSGTSAFSQLLLKTFSKSLIILLGMCFKNILCIKSSPVDVILTEFRKLFYSENVIFLFISSCWPSAQ